MDFLNCVRKPCMPSESGTRCHDSTRFSSWVGRPGLLATPACGKPNGDALFSRLEELLREKYEITLTSHQRKPTASIPADDKVLDELATTADAVVVGLGD